MTALRVTMAIRCESLVNYTFSKAYETDPSFEDTDEICDGFEAHMDHGIREIITRHDVQAADVIDEDTGDLKTPRYHVTFSVRRRGRHISSRHYRSYRREPICVEDAQDVAVEMDRMVAGYLVYHDHKFRWENPYYAGGTNPLQHRLAHPIINGTQGLACVPSRFAQPGYGIEVALRVNENGTSRDWMAEVSSRQSAPLTLAMAEALMADVSTIARHVVSELEESFETMHVRCTGLEGSTGCHHYSEDAFELQVRIDNNLGPAYCHLSDRIASYRILIPPLSGDMLNAFVDSLQAHIEHARDLTDHAMDRMDDLRIHIHELRGKDWSMQDPLVLSFDSSSCIGRDAITKIMGRLRSGIRYELQGRGVSALVTVHKRGHLIFDALFDGFGTPNDDDQLALIRPSELDKSDIQSRLAKRIQIDLWMSLKNTISGKGKNPLASLTIYTAPTVLERAISIVQSSYDSDNTYQTPSDQLRHTSKYENLRLLYAAHNLQAEEGAGVPTMPALVYTDEEVSSRETTPSLADTDSIGAPDNDDVVTPAGSPGKRNFWAADNGQDVGSVTYDQPPSGEDANDLKANHHQHNVHAIPGMHSTPRHEERKDENLVAMAGMVAQSRRRQVKQQSQVDKGQPWSATTTVRTQAPLIRRIISALYSQPNVNIGPSSACGRASEITTSTKKEAEPSDGEVRSVNEASATRGMQLKDPDDDDRRPLILRRLGSPRLADSTSSLVSATGHIVRRQQSLETQASSSS